MKLSIVAVFLLLTVTNGFQPNVATKKVMDKTPEKKTVPSKSPATPAKKVVPAVVPSKKVTPVAPPSKK